jgi:hypothetical protein
MSKTENIFDLSRLVANNDVEVVGSRTKTTVDQEKLLQGYEEVDASEWQNMTKDTNIRYLRKDGNMRSGGIIKRIWQEDGIIYIEMCSVFNSNANTWRIKLPDIEKIWKKSGQVVITNNQNSISSELQERIEYCEKSIKVIQIEIQKINNEQKRIITLISKIHKQINS